MQPETLMTTTDKLIEAGAVISQAIAIVALTAVIALIIWIIWKTAKLFLITQSELVSKMQQVSQSLSNVASMLTLMSDSIRVSEQSTLELGRKVDSNQIGIQQIIETTSRIETSVTVLKRQLKTALEAGIKPASERVKDGGCDA